MTDYDLAGFLNHDELPFPFCRGCGHGRILQQLSATLTRRSVDPQKTVIVTDIGCVGMSDRFFNTNTFHGLHGRSLTYATGIKLANPELEVVVLLGDGGAGIGGNHLIHAARRNIGLTALVFNNFNFGMTGGQHSPTTPPGALTPTTLAGQIDQPFDICGTVSQNGAGFVARTLVNDRDLPDLMDQALAHDGFALLDIWETCIRYAKANRGAKDRFPNEILKSGAVTQGVMQQTDRAEYTKAYRDAVARLPGRETQEDILPQFPRPTESAIRCVLAGSAGARVRSTGTLLSQAAMLADLWVTQRDEYPVTVAYGHSISQVILSPQEIQYTGISRPDWMVVLTPEGLRRTHRLISQMDDTGQLYLNAFLWPVETKARTVLLDFASCRHRLRQEEQTLVGLSAALHHSSALPLAALREAIRQQGSFVDSNLKLVEEGVELPLIKDPRAS